MRPEPLSPLQLHAIAAAMSTKLIALAAWLMEWGVRLPFHATLKRTLRAKLRRGAQAFQRIAFLLAARSIAPPQSLSKRTHHPANAPPGSIPQCIARLKHLIATIGRSIARIRKRLANSAKQSRLVIAYAIAAVASEGLRASPAPCTDTS